MRKLKIITSGESHGKGLVGIIDGLPSGIPIESEEIDRDLMRRQGGYGRGGRMQIESDHADILSGVRWGKSLGSTISVFVENRDWMNWKQGMSAEMKDIGSIQPVTRPRPGHADLPGGIKYQTRDFRNILERSSARETAARVALGAIAKRFLGEVGIFVGSFVDGIGSVKSRTAIPVNDKTLLKMFSAAEKSPVRCPDHNDSKRMVSYIDKAIKLRNSLGGTFTVFATGVPIGLGSHVQWDRKLDAMLAMAVMSIQAIKGVEIGMGFNAAEALGSDVMDEIYFDNASRAGLPFYRKSNNAGGIEGGMSNGMPIVIHAAMKPIPTLKKPLRSIDIITKQKVNAAYERSDVCAVPAASVVGEAMVALTLADAFLDKLGGDSMGEIKANYGNYLSQVKAY